MKTEKAKVERNGKKDGKGPPRSKKVIDKNDRTKKVNWKAKKKLEKKKKQGMVISTTNSSQNWKQIAEQIKSTQTSYRKNPKVIKKIQEKKKSMKKEAKEKEKAEKENNEKDSNVVEQVSFNFKKHDFKMN